MKLARYLPRVAQWLGLHIVIFFLLWSLWLAFEYFGFGPVSYVRIHDNGDSNLPARSALASVLADSQLGYWDPQMVSGADRLAAAFTGEIDSLFFAVFPGWLAYGLTMWFQRFVAGYFTFRLLRESLDLDTLPSLYAGMAYSLFAQGMLNVSWAGFTLYDGLALPGLPFVLWAVSRMDAAGWKYRSYLFAVGLGVLFAITASYAFTLFLMLAIFFWFLFVTPRPNSWILLLLFAVAWLFSEMPVLWASLLNAPLSHRADKVLNSPLSRGWLGTALFVFGMVRDNAVPFGLAFVGLIVSRGRERRLVLLLCAVTFCLGFVLFYPLLIGIVWEYLGFLSGFQFDRVYLLVPFLVTVSGGVGLHLVAQRWSKWRLALTRQTLYHYGLPLGTAIVLVGIGSVGWQSLSIQWRMLREMGDGSNFATLYRHPDLQRLAQDGAQMPPFRVATVQGPSAPVQHPAYAWAYGLESADGYAGLYPKRYQDYWGQVISPLTDVDQGRYNYFHYWGSRVYLFSPSDGFTPSEVRFEDYYDLELLSLVNVRYIISPLPLHDENLMLLPSDARDEQLAWVGRSTRDRLLGMLLGKYPGVPLYIYENRQVLPRFFLVGQTQVFDTPTQVLEALQQADYDDLKSTAYLERVDVADLSLDRVGGQDSAVALVGYTADRITLDVSAESAAILIATNNYSPYWKAWVDGAEATVFPVDHTFQGVYVEGGQHKVVLEYAPPYAIRFGQ